MTSPGNPPRLAYEALAPAGVIALFGHHYGFADDDLAEALNAVYLRVAPDIAEQPGGQPRQPGAFHPDELRESALFRDFEEQTVVTVVPFGTSRYLELLSTFSPHRMLSAQLRTRLHESLAEVIDEHGGVVRQKLTTGLWLARRR